MGAKLAKLLNDAIGKDKDGRAVTVKRMATEAGISVATVNQILRGVINCPPASRLDGFARALPVTAGAMFKAAESDGCSYGSKSEAVKSVSFGSYGTGIS